MTITKLGHCCLVIREKGLTVLTDPGGYTTAQNDVLGVNVVLITHEHGDHLHIESLKTVLKNNSSAKVITNNGVAKMLEKEGIAYELLVHGQNTTVGEILIEGFGEKHAEIYSTITPIDVTGYFIANRFFYPGDAFTNPGKPVEILALPVAGPFVKVSDFMEYAKLIHPKVSFPVHDGGLKHFGSAHRVPLNELPKLGIGFIVPEEGREMEF